MKGFCEIFFYCCWQEGSLHPEFMASLKKVCNNFRQMIDLLMVLPIILLKLNNNANDQY